MNKEIDEVWNLLMTIEMKAQYFPVILEIQKRLKMAADNHAQILADKEALMERMGAKKGKKAD